MREGLLGAGLLLALTGSAWGDRVHLAGTGIVDPMVSTRPDDGDVAPRRGLREVEPAGETDNTFIGRDWSDDAPAPPPPKRRPPSPPRPRPQAESIPQRLPGEGVQPPSDDMPGEPEALAALPAAPYHLRVEEDVAVAPAKVSQAAVALSPVAKKLAASRESLPDLPATPAHEEKAVQPKDVELEEVSLAHDAVPDLIDILKTGSPRQRERAADELGRRGPDAKPAVSALIAALKGPDRLKASAALALGDIGGDTQGLEKLLRPLLKSKSADVRTSAETALERLGGGR